MSRKKGKNSQDQGSRPVKQRGGCRSGATNTSARGQGGEMGSGHGCARGRGQRKGCWDMTACRQVA